MFVSGLAGTAVLTLAFLPLPPGAVGWMFAAEILRQFVYGFTVPLLWAMMADVADYSEWQKPRRATGIVFSGIVFALKAGLGSAARSPGTSSPLWLCAERGANRVGARGHPLCDERLPGVGFALCAACLIFYGIDRGAEITITTELKERRKLYADRDVS